MIVFSMSIFVPSSQHNDLARTLSELPREHSVLPKRQKPHGYREPDYPFKFIPETA